ncbi:MAG: S-layer homology domain-containing protein [Actinomycetota bacterium]
MSNRSIGRRVIALLVVAVSLAGTAPAGAVAGFGDVSDDVFYTEAVQWMVDEGITAGTAPGCFSPDAPATRAEVAVFLHRLRGEPGGGSEPFTDVAPGSFYAGAVAWMYSTGVTTGTSPTEFSPSRLVTRGEVATFLHRVAGLPDGGGEPFTDVEPTDFFGAAVAWMAGTGITTGTSPTSFSPDRPVTRAEVATFLYRFVESPPVAVDPGGVCSLDEHADLAEAEQRSFELLNELRTSLGLEPLVRVSEMNLFARDWSSVMHDSGAFVHSTGPYGENIAWWSRDSANPDAAAGVMHELWVTSPGHYRNMTNARYTQVGVGFWRGEGGWYATHVFR